MSFSEYVIDFDSQEADSCQNMMLVDELNNILEPAELEMKQLYIDLDFVLEKNCSKGSAK